MIEFVVYGEPKPQGSKKAFYVPKLKRAVVVDDNKKSLRTWRDSVMAAARDAMEGRDPMGVWPPDYFPIGGFVRVDVVFWYARPKTHLRAKGLKKGAPLRPPIDVDKLQRSLGDALTQAGLLRDDKLISRWDARKRYSSAGRSGMRVRIRPDLDEATP